MPVDEKQTPLDGPMFADGATVRGPLMGANVALADMIFGSDAQRHERARLFALTPQLVEALTRADDLLSQLRAHDLDDAEDIETLALIGTVLQSAGVSPGVGRLYLTDATDAAQPLGELVPYGEPPCTFPAPVLPADEAETVTFHYTVTGSLIAPKGSALDERETGVILPDGQLLKVWEGFELHPGGDVDPVDISFDDMSARGLHYDGEPAQWEQE